MKSTRTAAIAGIAAIILLIVTIVIVSPGKSNYGLYISSVTGNVNISNTAEGTSVEAAADKFLSPGDILTVNEGGSCMLIYRTRDNYNENYMIVEPSSQIFVTGDFNSKSDGEIYLNRGSILVNSIEKASCNILVRTENSSVTTEGAAIRIAYMLGDVNATEVASFGGASRIQLYDPLGNAVTKDGVKAEEPQLLLSGRKGRIISGNPVPKFETLNIDTLLSDYNSETLRELITISSFHELAFSSADIKAAYDEAPAVTEPVDVIPPESETPTETTVPEVTTETTASVPSETEETETEATTVPTVTETAQTTTTTRATTTTPFTTTTAAPTTTTQATTTTVTTTRAQETTATTASEKTFTVYIIVEDEIYTQDVPYGGSASIPEIPNIYGKRFVGWDDSFDNITGERTISAIFEDVAAQTSASETQITFDTESSGSSSYVVTIVINGVSSTQVVRAGGSATLPEVSIPGYEFLGWDRSPDNITSDTTITAKLIPVESVWGGNGGGGMTEPSVTTHTVTFVIDGISYPVTVKDGESAAPPILPSFNSLGQQFIGWGNDFSNVTSDITVYAVYA